jgi:hypothetical protein
MGSYTSEANMRSLRTAKEANMALTQSEQRDLQSYMQHQQYMKTYNQRPEVREKRRAYNKARNARLKEVAQKAREEGVLPR